MQDMHAPSVATQATLADTDSADAQTPKNLVPCDSVYALGDCAGYVDGPLPALAQVWATYSLTLVSANASALVFMHALCQQTHD